MPDSPLFDSEVHERLALAMVGEGDDGTEALFDPYCSTLLNQVFGIQEDEGWNSHYLWASVAGGSASGTCTVKLCHPLDAAIVINATLEQPRDGLPTRVIVLLPPRGPESEPIVLTRSTPVVLPSMRLASPMRSPFSSSTSSPTRTPKHGVRRGLFRPPMANPDYDVKGPRVRIGRNWAIVCRGSGMSDAGLLIHMTGGSRLLVRSWHEVPNLGQPLLALFQHEPRWHYLQAPGGIAALAASQWRPTVDTAACRLRSDVAAAFGSQTGVRVAHDQASRF